MIVMGHVTNEEGAPTQPDHGIGAIIRNVQTGLHVIRDHLFRPPAIACDECRCNAGAGQNPFEIFGAKTRWAGPEFFLVTDDVFEKRRN